MNPLDVYDIVYMITRYDSLTHYNYPVNKLFLDTATKHLSREIYEHDLNKLSYRMLKDFKYYLIWDLISRRRLKEDVIKKYLLNLNMEYVSRFSRLSERFIKMYLPWLDVCYLIHYQDLSEWVIEYIMQHSGCRVDWWGKIRKEPPNHYWKYVWQRQKVSEKFIRRNIKHAEFSYISANQTLSEEFMYEFRDRLNWTVIASEQKMSPEFINKPDIRSKIRKKLLRNNVYVRDKIHLIN
jgi:hypothetical protein